MDNKISNLRDMSNITFHDGKHLKPNTIIRCTELSSLNKNQKKLVHLLIANQIILNNFDTLKVRLRETAFLTKGLIIHLED